MFSLLVMACSQTSSQSHTMPKGDPRGGATSDAASAAIGDAAGAGAVDAASTPAKTDTVTITAGGRARTVIVHSPPNLQRPTALVFNLHGSGGTAAAQEAYTNMDAAADRLGFVAAYAEGGIALGGGFAWNVPGQPLADGTSVPADASDDVAFFAQAIASLEGSYPIDPRRIYFSGYSGGGRMTSQIGCDLSNLVAAVAPVAGLRFPSPCNSARPVPVIAFHGTGDTTNPYNGGGPPYWTESVPSAEQHWGAHNGCATTPTGSAVATGVALTAYTGCTAGADVELFTTEGAGHIWPGAPGQNDAIDATSVMWSFFSAHPLP